MVFKGRFFSSKKSSQSSPSGSNTSSPRSPASNSPNKSEKKKSKSHFGDGSVGVTGGSLAPDSEFKTGFMKKEVKGKERDEEAPCSVSPIMASSLGLNKIKTRSGPLPQESFFGFKGPSGVGLGSSNLGSVGKKKKKEVKGQSKIGVLQNVGADDMSNSRNLATGSFRSVEQSPNVKASSLLEDDQSGRVAGLLSAFFMMDFFFRLCSWFVHYIR